MTKDEALSAKHEGATTVALKLALEALDGLSEPYDVLKAQEAIREALALSESSTKCEETSHAQPDVDRRSTESKETFDQQEPVVWMYQNKSTHEVRFQKHMRSFVDHGAWYEVPLYSEPLANQEKTSGSPKPAKTEALRLADAMEYDLDWCDEAAAELRRMHDLLGKANALCRIRAEEIERLKAQPEHSPNCALLKIPSKDCDCQDQQEPVAITITGKLGNIYSFTGDYSLKKGDKVYTTPPQPEPVIDKSAAVRIATALGWEPKRKPLTIVELQKHWQVAKVLDMTDAEISFPDYVLITKDVEAAHGIKE